MKTIIELLENSTQKYANNPYILEKKTDRYEALTYRETRDEAYKVAAGLLALGIQKGDRIALISESRTDWVISELGILHAQAICVPLSILLKEGSDLKFRLDHSGSKYIIVSKQQIDKINPIKQDLKNLEKIILLDPEEIGVFLIFRVFRAHPAVTGLGNMDEVHASTLFLGKPG